MGHGTGSIDWREPWLAPVLRPWLLLSVVVLALLARVLWIMRFGQVIENEGTTYVVLARSLLDGEGYIGVLGDRHTLMPPLLSFLIAALASATGDIEMAARWLSCLAGVATLWPAYLIARFLGGVRAGLVAAGLFALHGLTLGFSGATYGEGTFFFLLFAATAALIHAVERGGVLKWLCCGLLYALAYLVRPETIAYLGLAAVFVLWRAWVRRDSGAPPRAYGAAVMVLVCALAVAPYVIWLSTNSGHFRLEGKSDSNGLVNQRMANGMTYEQASRGLTADLQAAGPDLIANQFQIPAPAQSGLAAALQTVFQDPVSRSVRALTLWIRDPNCGGLLLMGLGLVGMLAALLSGSRNIPVALLFLCMTAGYLGLILSVRWFMWDRYIYPFTYFMLIWASVGIAWLVEITGRLAGRVTASVTPQLCARSLVLAGLVGAVIAIGVQARYSPMFFQSHDDWALTLKEAGQRIRDQSHGRPMVMGISAVTPFYAGGFLTYLPWLPEHGGRDALAFIHGRNPDFIVLRTAEQWAAPYTAEWLREGIPDDCATELFRLPESASEFMVAYEWTCGQQGNPT